MRLILFIILIPICSFAQVNKTTTTKEYYPNSKIRRTTTIDNEFNIVSEIYYRESNSLPIAKIEYNSKNNIKSVVFYKNDGIKKEYLIDFDKGQYFDYENNLSLLFKENFVFNGKQTGDRIISYYKDGGRNGPVLQYDSTATGKVLSNKIFVDYNYTIINGQVFITGKTAIPLYDDSFSIYKGIYCNFKNDELNGANNVYYFNGKKKIQSNFKQGKCINYSSFDDKGDIITKIKCKDGVLFGKAIINGSLQDFDNNNLIWFHSLSGAGEVYATYYPNKFDESESNLNEETFAGIRPGEIIINLPNKINAAEKWNTGQLIRYKNDFDKSLSPAENIIELRLLLGIPYFYLNRYDFDKYDKDEYAVIKIDKNSLVDSTGLHPTRYLINTGDSLLYLRNAFFKNDNYHTWDNFFNNVLWENTKNRLKAIEIKKHHFITWLKNGFNYSYGGDTDVFDPTADSILNRNESIISFLKSYSRSIILNSISLYKNGGITNKNFINPLYSFNQKFAFPAFASEDTDSIFQILSKDKNMVFFINQRDSTEEISILSFNLLEKINGIKYEITFETYGLNGRTSEIIKKDAPWKFKILDSKNKEYYRVSNGNEEINALNDTIKKSLELIYQKLNE